MRRAAAAPSRLGAKGIAALGLAAAGWLIASTFGVARAQQTQPGTPDAPPAATEPSAAEDASARELVIARPRYQAGQIYLYGREIRHQLNVSIHIDGRPFDRLEQTQRSVARTRATIQEVDANGAVVRAEFLVPTRLVVRTTQGGPERSEESPMTGRTYIATVGEGGAVTIALRGDGEVNAVEADAIRDEFEVLRQGSPLARFLAEQPRAVGEEISLDPALAQGLLAGAGGLVVQSFHVTPTRYGRTDSETPERIAIYRVRTQLAGDLVAGLAASLTLEGDLHIRTSDGKVLGLQLRGNLSMSVEQAHGDHRMQLGGTGAASVSLTVN